MDVPEEDGVVYVKNTDNLDLIGKFASVEIIDYKDYDLIGKIGNRLQVNDLSN